MPDKQWTYRWNNEGSAEDGFILIDPSGFEVGLIYQEVDAKSLVYSLNEKPKLESDLEQRDTGGPYQGGEFRRGDPGHPDNEMGM